MGRRGTDRKAFPLRHGIFCFLNHPISLQVVKLASDMDSRPSYIQMTGARVLCGGRRPVEESPTFHMGVRASKDCIAIVVLLQDKEPN